MPTESICYFIILSILSLSYGCEIWQWKTAEMKFMRHTTWYGLLDNRWNEIIEKLAADPVEKELVQYKQKWLNHVSWTRHWITKIAPWLSTYWQRTLTTVKESARRTQSWGQNRSFIGHICEQVKEKKKNLLLIDCEPWRTRPEVITQFDLSSYRLENKQLPRSLTSGSYNLWESHSITCRELAKKFKVHCMKINA